MGEGISNYLSAAVRDPTLLTQKTYDATFRVIARTITAPKNHGSEAMVDWMAALRTLISVRREGWERKGKLA